MKAIVQLENVTKDYGKGQALTHALRGVNLELEAGEFTAMAGPSGSGKSTLLNIIGGLDRPTSGKVEVDGQELVALSKTELGLLRRDRLGFIFQSYNLIPVLTALENAEYVLMLQGIPTHERRQRVREVFKEVGLEGLENRYPRELSGGQQQILAFGRALMARPKLLILDEPCLGLAPVVIDEIYSIVHNINQSGVSVFLAEQNVSLALRLGTYGYVLEVGKVILQGDMEELRNNEVVNRAYLGE